MPTTMTPRVRFGTIGGVRIRYADSGGSHETTVLLTSPWQESVYASRRSGRRLPGTPACSPWTCRVSQYASAVLDSIIGNWL